MGYDLMISKNNEPSNIFMKLLKFYNGYFLCRIFTCDEFSLNHYQTNKVRQNCLDSFDGSYIKIVHKFRFFYIHIYVRVLILN